MPTIVQSRSAAQISTLAFSSNVSAGNLLVVCFTTESSLTGVSIADTRGTSYSVAITTSGNTTVRMYYGSAPSSGANTVTFSGGSPTFPSIALTEISGAQPVLDGTPVGAGSGATSPGSLTTTFANSIAVVGLGGFSSLAVWTPPGSWTIPTQTWAAGLAYTVEASPGTLNPTFGGTNIVFATLVMAAFKAAPFSPTNMTANNAPSPYVVIATSGPIAPFNLFNGTTFPWQGNGSGNDWAQLDAGAGNEHVLTSYTIQAYDTSTRNPQTWIIQGSNDQVKYDTLDSRSGQTGWATGEIRTYTCSTPTTAYRYFRLWVTANNGDVTYTQVGELSLYGTAGSPPPPNDFAPHNLTVDVSPPYHASADSTFTAIGGPWNPYCAFDGLGITTNNGWLGNVPSSGWLQIDLGPGASKTLTGYAIRCRLWNWAPTAWAMQGSNDGVSWTALDSRSGITNWHDTGTWPVNEAKYYPVSSGTGYRYFRLNITATPGVGYGPAVSELYLYGSGASGSVPPDFAPHNMTANNLPSPYVASADSSRSGYFPYNVFAGNPTGTPWDNDVVSSSSTPSYVEIDIGAGNEHNLSYYAVQAGFHLGNQVSAWQIQGSNDLVRWTTLDSQTAQTGWSAGENRFYALGSVSAAYRYFRLYITGINGGTGTMLGQLYLYGVAGTPISGDPDFAPHDLTSNTSHSPFVVSASSHAVSTYSYDSFLAFDGNLTVAPAEWTSTTPAAWIQLDLGSGNLKALTSYGVAGGFQGFPNRTPKNWTMQGSLDGITWVILDTQVNQTGWNLQWAVPEIRVYTATSSVGYRYFRLNITANNGDVANTGIFQIYLFGYTPAGPPQGKITTAKGTIIKISDTIPPVTYVAIGEVRSISGPSTRTRIVDITTHDTPSNWSRKLGVMNDAGDVTFEINFDYTDATHAFTTGMWNQMRNLLKSGFQIIFPNSAGTLTYQGYIGQHEFSAPVDNVLSAKIMLAITDAILASNP